MASIILNAAGAALGGPIGGAIGSIIGAAIDARHRRPALAPDAAQSRAPRLEDLRVTGATEGAVIPRVYGRMRTGGNIIWATDFREEVRPRTRAAAARVAAAAAASR